MPDAGAYDAPRLRGALAAVLALFAAFFVWHTWGGLDRPGLYHDEKAYVLQAREYAHLEWSEPTPPVPGLWEQVHVFVQPRYASRYPPGFPAVLALGAAIGKPGLIVVACAGLTAALLFLFGATLIGTGPAFVATALWSAAPANTVWRAAYFSESLTCLLWVAWCWCALRYRREGKLRDFVFTSVLVAVAGITRPVTGLALAAPLPFILWPRLRTPTGLRHFLIATAAGLVVCSPMPFWNHAVLGSWTKLPYAEYSAHTFPFDMPSWHTNWSPPPRDIPPDFEAFAAEQKKPYEQRTLASLPGAFVARANAFSRAALPPGLQWLRFVAPIGLLLAGGAGWVALASALLLLAAHITMPHPSNWTIYYLDVFPVVTFGVVIAIDRAVRLLVTHTEKGLMAAGAALLMGGAVVWRPPPVDDNGWMHREMFFRAGLCALPAGKRIVFVHPRPGSSLHHSLVDNDPRWETSDTWIVREWDVSRQRALLGAAPDRAAYFYDENAGWLAKMHRDGTPSRDGVVNVLRADLGTGRGIACR